MAMATLVEMQLELECTTRIGGQVLIKMLRVMFIHASIVKYACQTTKDWDSTYNGVI